MLTVILTTVFATFLAGTVESVETLTVVLAVGLTRGWRSALAGVGAGLVVLAALIGVLGTVLLRVLPLHLINLVIGLLLLLFGMRWLIKAVLRSGHRLRLRDEAAVFERQRRRLEEVARAGESARRGIDRAGFAVTVGSVVLEGAEIAFTVIAFGSVRGMLSWALIGAAAGIILVAIVGIIAHRPLARVPENGLKYAVGVMLSALGSLWTSEGLGVRAALGPATYLAFVGVWLLASVVTVALLRREGPGKAEHSAAAAMHRSALALPGAGRDGLVNGKGGL